MKQIDEDLNHTYRCEHLCIRFLVSICIRKIVYQEHVVFSYPISRRSYIHKVLCSEGHMLYVQKIFVQKFLCSDGLLFRRSYVWKVLCSEGPVFRRSLLRRSYVGTHFHLSVSARNIVLLNSLVSGMKTFFLSQLISRFFFISSIIVLFTPS